MHLPSHHSRLWRLHFTLIDQPGTLAAAADALAALDVNILGIDTQVISAREVLDEATISVPPWLDLPAVEHALRRIGATDVRAVAVPARRLEDTATKVLHLAAAVLAEEGDEALRDAIGELIDAELVVASSPVAGAGASAAEDGLVQLGREHVKRLPCREGAWTMRVPDDSLAPARVIFAARRSAAFTSTEAARTRALLGLCRVVAPARRPVAAGHASPAVCVGPLTPANLEDIEDLHRRCSPTSLYQRYLSPMPSIRGDLISRLLDGARSRIALGAWSGDRLVGMANACPVDGGSGGPRSELAVLVADSRQGQGVGTLLVEELLAVATRRGTSEFVLLTLATNRPMARIVHRLGHDVRQERDDGTVTFTFTRPAGVSLRR